MGVEPTTQAWEACILPLNYTCIGIIIPQNKKSVKVFFDKVLKSAKKDDIM